MAPTTAFLLAPASALHDTGWNHPEHQGRLRALTQTVGRDMMALHGRAEQADAGEPAGEEDLLRVHGKGLLEDVRSAVRQAAARQTQVFLAADTPVSAASWDAAVGSAGAAIEACRLVAEGAHRNAFVATRPPGHHATPDQAMGFCLFNSVAVAARWLQAHGHAERVLIVDWDVHHGNGTQDVFYEDPSVFFLSLHQWPHYPGTGAVDETGAGEGAGTTLNVPLPAGTTPAAYRERFERALDDVFGRFEPDFVLVSSGFDCLADDPLGGLLLEPADVHALARTLMERSAASPAGERIVALLEGGYDPRRTGLGAVSLLRALADVDQPDPTLPVG